MSSVNFIKMCLDILHYSGAAALTRGILRGRGTIFCLHHVLPASPTSDQFVPNAHLETTPEFLAEIIKLVRDRGYVTLSLAEALQTLKAVEPPEKPFAVFTLDDGYKDNLIYAQPVFHKLSCPFTVFVTPGIVEGTTELWWRGLESVIAKNSEISVQVAGQNFTFKIETVQEKNQAWQQIAPALQVAPEYEQRIIIRDLCGRYGVDLFALCKKVAMTWDEIRKIARDPLCTIGAHTMGHYLLAKLSPEDAYYEMEQSATIIARELGRPAQFFAYPYGDETAAGPRDFALARKAGFEASVTTRKGVVFSEHKLHLQALPRIMVSSRLNKIRYIDALLSGTPTFLLNKFRKVSLS
jgi:peptidoglycan/xylan/chitin deacetylase (PgdA/CDA1 family)